MTWVFPWYLLCSILSYGIIFAWAINDDELLLNCEGNIREMEKIAKLLAVAGSIYGPISLLYAICKTRMKDGARWTV